MVAATGRNKWRVGESDEVNSFLEENGKVKSDSPIADLYPECSVFFADMVGFTRWSSGRTPCVVFELLEKLYTTALMSLLTDVLSLKSKQCNEAKE